MRFDPWGGLEPEHPPYCTCVECVRRRLATGKRQRPRQGLIGKLKQWLSLNTYLFSDNYPANSTEP